MPSRFDQRNFGEIASSSWTLIPGPALGLIVLVAAMSPGLDLVAWARGWKPPLAEALWSIAGLSVFLFGAIYVAAMGLLECRPSGKGLVRFLLTTLLLALPCLIGLAVGLFGQGMMADALRFSVFALFAGLGWIAITLLPAWPVAQSLTDSIISPFAIFRATKGHRWRLFSFSMVLGIVTKGDFIPPMEKAGSVGAALLIMTGNAVLTTIQLGLTACIAAASWQVVVRNDPSLDRRAAPNPEVGPSV